VGVRPWLSILAWLAALPLAFHLPRGTDSYFIEDAGAYRRLLHFSPGAAYSEIDQDRTTNAQTDRGAWEQDARGLILLHPVFHALRPRALVAGPLALVLDRPGALEALPILAEGIRAFLSGAQAGIFAADDARELDVRPPGFDAPLSFVQSSSAFARADLESLLRQIDDLLWSLRMNTTILQPARVGDRRVLFLAGPLYQPPQHGFAQVDERTFARTAGAYAPLRSLGHP
jgi:hypothetical protein